jgi:hypothetical protein
VLPASYDGEVISAPWVVRAGGDYHMWFSTRGHETREAKNYHMGYARSTDGVAWTRNDGVNTIDKSPTGWDSEMVCYPAFHGFEDRTYMFYCGNAVGRGGIGWAVSTNFLEGLAR